jgi:sigma-B regulation protein RsbU (phosphoserine phosphatase)
MGLEHLPELLRQCQKRNERLQKALEVNHLISGELQLGPLLHQVMHITQSIMDAEACSVFLVDEETSELVFHAASGKNEAKMKEICRLRIGCGIAGWCAAHIQTVRLTDVYADPRFNSDYDKQTGFTTRNMICSPLIAYGRLIGVTQVINHAHGDFTEADEQLLESLALMIAIAIDNAHTHQRLLKQQMLQRDMELAKSIQRSFLPARPPQTTGFEAAFQMNSAFDIGGDLYDALLLPDKRVAYLLGDISGKGVAAALVMSSILKDIRSELALGGDAGDILSRFNASFSTTVSKGMFVTMMLMILDPATGRLETANAGHLPPAHLLDDRIWLGKEASGPPAGILPDIRYVCEHDVLRPGEMILLYTDGVTEAANEDRDMVGSDTLLSWLQDAPRSPEECISLLLRRVQIFAGEAQQTDDITMLALKNCLT